MAKKRVKKTGYENILGEIKTYKQLLKDKDRRDSAELRKMIAAREQQLKMFRRKTFYEHTRGKKKK